MTLALPQPKLYISRAADDLDAFAASKNRRPWHADRRASRVGDYVSMIGLAASSCGIVVSVNEQRNRAMVSWFILDPEHWRKYYISSLCRWTDLYEADQHMIERAAASRC